MHPAPSRRDESCLLKTGSDDAQLNAELLNILGVIQYCQGKLNKAKTSFLRAAEVRFTSATLTDVDLGEILNNLGYVYQAKREYAKAEDAYKQSVQVSEIRFGSSHLRLAAPLDNLASVYSDMGNYGAAEQNFQRSLAILEQAEAPFNEPFVMHTLYGLGKMYIREKDEVRSNEPLARAAEIARRLKVREMPEALDVLDTYSRVLSHLSNSQEAERVEREARRMRATLAFTVSAPGTH